MSTEIIMPKAGMAMESGTVIQWYKTPGEYVEAGEPLLEIETDKVAMEVEAEVSGYLLATLFDAGDEVPVITTIGYLGEKGESAPSGQEATSKSSDRTVGDRDTPSAGSDTDGDPAHRSVATGTDASGGRIAATPAARTRAAENGIELSAIAPTGQWGEVRLRDVDAAADSPASVSPDPKASPLAKKIAEDRGVDLSGIPGSGPSGRIMKRDVPAVGANAAGQRDPGPGEQRVPLKGMRKVIAERMAASHAAVPPVTLNRKVVVDELLSFRKRINDTIGPEDIRISVTDLIIKAVAVALIEAPYMRTRIEGSELVTTDRIDIGMAVALEEGLLVPVIRDVDARTISALAAARVDLAERARNRALSPDEVRGATFTVTNLGMYGISSFTPIVNTPESGILGVNATEDRLYLDDGGMVQSQKVMTLSLTIDHRVVDGAQGAIFLNALATVIEEPVRILL